MKEIGLIPDGTKPHQCRNLTLLSTTWALQIAVLGAHATIGGLAGELLGGKTWATLPVALVDAGMLFGVVPASFMMARHGRKVGFLVCGTIAFIAAVTSALGLHWSSFLLFNLGSLLLGVMSGFAQYIRYAASEASSPDFRSRAIALVISGGAILGGTLPFGTVRNVSNLRD